ncbi:MAG: ABC-2 transporter permease [Lachnospiraceae bacterium]|nr:ABC-2 transporter permease [Lachnospiraceae bacterium]
MKGLLYKDYILFKKSLLSLGIFVLFIITFCFFFTYLQTDIGIRDEEDALFLMLITAIFYFAAFIMLPTLSTQLFTPDEKPASVSFLFSTPPAAKGQIQSKYYFLLLVNLGILFVCFLTDTVVLLMVGEHAASATLACVIFFCLNLILLAIRIPFSIRYGSAVSFEVQMVYIILFSTIFTVYALFGNISFFFQENILKALMEYLQSEKVIFVISFIPYISVLAYYISYRISLALYRKGVETYEQ